MSTLISSGTIDYRMALPTALQIADGVYLEMTLSNEFRAVSVLQSHLIDIIRNHEERSEGYTRSEIEEGLMSLAHRQSFSDHFRECVDNARRRLLNFTYASDRLLSDIKHWSALSAARKQSTCNMVMVEIDTIFRNHEDFPWLMCPEIKFISDNRARSYVDKRGEHQSYVPTVWADFDNNGLLKCIAVNTHSSGHADDPCRVLAGLFGGYLDALNKHLCKYPVAFPPSRRAQFENDVRLITTAHNEGGFIDPFLDRFHEAQFTTSFINAQKTALVEELTDMIEREWDSIQAPQMPPESLGTRIKSAISGFGFNL